MSKKKKRKKKTVLPVRQLAVTRSGGTTTYYRKGKECHCARSAPPGRRRSVIVATPSDRRGNDC